MGIACEPELHRHPTITPEQRAARQRGKLDCRCNRCGHTSASTARCNQCHTTDLTHFTHADNGGQCVMGGGGAGRDGLKQPDRAVSAGKTTDAPPAALSAAGPGAGLTLWGAS